VLLSVRPSVASAGICIRQERIEVVFGCVAKTFVELSHSVVLRFCSSSSGDTSHGNNRTYKYYRVYVNAKRFLSLLRYITSLFSA
jgi:hypothetical protein